MQTLGLGESDARSESRWKSLFWPSIQSGADVDYLAVQGYWVCTAVAVLSFGFLAFRGQPVIAVLILLFFHFGGVGVREHSSFAAAIVLGYYLLDTLISLRYIVASPAFIVLRTIIVALLLSNFRATWIASNWRPDSEEAELPPRFGETFTDKLADQWPAWIWPKTRIVYFIYAIGLLLLTIIGIIALAVKHAR